MTITSSICSLFITLVASGLAIACYYAGRDDEKEDNRAPLIIMCVLFLIIFGLVSFGASYLIIGSALEKGMLHRLNTPIVSSQQLYGYEILGKKTQKSEFSQTYFIDIKDLLEELYEITPILLKNIGSQKNFSKNLK